MCNILVVHSRCFLNPVLPLKKICACFIQMKYSLIKKLGCSPKLLTRCVILSYQAQECGLPIAMVVFPPDPSPNTQLYSCWNVLAVRLHPSAFPSLPLSTAAGVGSRSTALL